MTEFTEKPLHYQIMFGDSTQMHEAYFDRDNKLGVNFPIHVQLADHFSGQILQIDRTIDYEDLKVKVYATKENNNHFIMILNKDVSSEHVIEVNLSDLFTLTMRLPQRSYTSLIIDQNGIIVSGIGN